MARARNKNEVTEATAAAEAAELDAIEAALNGDMADLEIEDSRFAEEPEAPEVMGASEPEIETVALEADPEFDEAELTSALEADEAMLAAYEEQESEIDLAGDDEVSAAAAAAAKAETKAGKAPRGERKKKEVVTEDPAVFADAALKAFSGEEITLDSEEGALDADAFIARMKSVSQKKVREKVLNMIDAVVGGARPSVYTQIAGKLMAEAAVKGETVTVGQIKAAYEAKGYKGGTVAAQAGQMMSLFPILGMAKVGAVKGALEPNPSSVLLDFLAEG